MTELQVINQQQVLGQSFKMYGTFDEPLFLAKDVAEWIEHSRASEMLKGIDEDEKLLQTILASGQNREMWFLTEDGLYEVLMQSRKPIAKAFKKEVKKILKNLRKGSLKLNVPSYQIENPIERAKAWIVEEEKRQKLQLEVKESKELLIEQTPKVQAFDVITANTDKLYTITQIAANYGMSGIKLNALLHKLGVQYKVSGTWKLYAKYEGNGYTVTPTGLSDDGHTFKIMKWTNKGEHFLYNLLKEHGYTSTSYDLI